MSSNQSTYSLFTFGSLMDSDVLRLVTDMSLDQLKLSAGTADGFSPQEVKQESYPVLVANPDACTEGLLIEGLTQLAMQRILFFEGDEYVLEKIDIELANGVSVGTKYFSHAGVYDVLEKSWNYENWQRDEKALLLRHTQSYMDLFGTMTASEADQYWGSKT